MTAFTTTTMTLFCVALFSNASLLAQNDLTYVQPRALVVQSWDNSRALTGSRSGENYSFLTGPGYARARAVLQEKIPYIEFRSGISRITTEALVGVDLFIIGEQKGLLNAEEITALERWVNAGGALLVTENGGSPLFGVTPGVCSWETAPKVLTPTSPLFQGPFGTIAFGVGMGFHMSFATTGDAVVVAANSDGPNMLQFNPTSTRFGRAVFISDEEIFMTGKIKDERDGKLTTHPVNEVLLCNLFAWLAAVPGANGGFTPLGKGCPGSNGTPQIALQAGSTVKAGHPMHVALTNLPSGVGHGEVMMLIGSFLDTPIDLDIFGAPGCRLYLDQVVFDFRAVATGAGTATWSITIPPSVGVPLYSVHMQAVVPDPFANGLNLSFSNAARIDIYSHRS